MLRLLHKGATLPVNISPVEILGDTQTLTQSTLTTDKIAVLCVFKHLRVLTLRAFSHDALHWALLRSGWLCTWTR